MMNYEEVNHVLTNLMARGLPPEIECVFCTVRASIIMGESEVLLLADKTAKFSKDAIVRIQELEG